MCTRTRAQWRKLRFERESVLYLCDAHLNVHKVEFSSHLAHTIPCDCWLLTMWRSIASNARGRVVRLRNGAHRVNVAISGHSTDLPRSCARCRLYPHAFTSGEAQLTLSVLTSRRSVALLVAHAHENTIFCLRFKIIDSVAAARSSSTSYLHSITYAHTFLTHVRVCTRAHARALLLHFFSISKSSTTQSVCTRSAQRASSKSTSTSMS